MMEYVKERKLICASLELAAGKKIIDIAMEYGYQTHSGFSKAFKKQFGFPPTFINAMRMSCNELDQTGGSKHMSFGEEKKKTVFIKQYQDFTEPEVLYANLLQTMEANAVAYHLEKIECAYKMACVVHEGENPDCILIKLADRLHNMRTIKYMEENRLKEKAKETIAFFSPIAIKLGNEKIKRELDDLALRYV